MHHLLFCFRTIPTETYNALFLVRVFLKQFAGNLTNKEIIEQIEDDGSKKGEEFVESLIYVLINQDPNTNYSTYEFYTEVLNTFLVFCSSQYKSSRDQNYFLTLLTSKFENRAETVVARLLENVIEQKTPPPQSSGVMYTAYNYFFAPRASSSPDADIMPVSDRSLLLLLLLGMQHVSKENSEWIQSYHFAIANLSDHHGKITLEKVTPRSSLSLLVVSSDIDGHDRKMHLVSFKDLFEIFCKSIHVEEKMLLFYLILVGNEAFRVYVLSRTDQETIVRKTSYTTHKNN